MPDSFTKNLRRELDLVFISFTVRLSVRTAKDYKFNKGKNKRETRKIYKNITSNKF